MNKKLRVFTGSVFFSFCLCAFLAFPAFGQWSYEQIDPDCMITSMWAASETDIYVGGGKTYDACLYHYDGAGWIEISALHSISGPIFDIWGVGGNDVYVAGLEGWWHYDGSTWTEEGTTITEGVWGFEGGDLFLAYSPVIARRHAGQWQTMILPAGLRTPIQIRGFWGTSQADMYAVGRWSTILHYDGNANGEWSLLNAGLAGTSYDLYSVWGTASNDIFAAGGAIILHYNGSTWSKIDISSLQPGWVTGLWGSSSQDVYASTTSGKILHYDGVSWSHINIAEAGLAQQDLSPEYQLSSPSELPASVALQTVCGISAESIYFAGDDGIVIHYTPDVAECEDDGDCEEGYECVEGTCEPIQDDPPCLTSGPFLAAGSWPVLPTSAESAFELDANYDVLWTFSDDFASCSGACTHVAEYQAVGDSSWTALPVTVNVAKGRVRVTLPVESLQNAHVCLPVCGNRLRFTDNAVGNILF